jgi:hypothetical protein
MWEQVFKNKDTSYNFNSLLYIFINIFEVSDAISFLKRAFPRKFPRIRTIPTTETEIKCITHSIKAKHSSSYDQITSKILNV